MFSRRFTRQLRRMPTDFAPQCRFIAHIPNASAIRAAQYQLSADISRRARYRYGYV